MPDRLLRDFPLFPLGIVTLPTEYVPLHVFEERYKALVDECLSRECEFGIVWLAGDELKEVGCAVTIERVLERMDDGRMNILCRGTRPFRLVERHDDLPYPAGTIEWLDDAVPVDPEVDAQVAAEAGRRAREAYAELVLQAADRTLDPDELAEMSAYEMAATVDFGLDAKQGLLELRSETARLKLVERLFRAAAKRLDYVERAQARAASNGKVRFG
jgi:Lon protease-like protein